MRTIYRYEVPLDDAPHKILLTDLPPGGHVAVKYDPVPVVEFWAEYDDSMPLNYYEFRVFGTGHEVPEDYWYVATAPRNAGMVFHLYVKFS